MTRFDYVVVGAGPAGCVLANRLSADPAVGVLLVEAGRRDTNPLIAMPRGFGELLGDPATAWHYPTRAFGPLRQVEYWVRGRTLGGSSSVNGMIGSGLVFYLLIAWVGERVERFTAPVVG